MHNVYHILYQYPALEWYEMSKENELLAQQLVASGLLRIDALEKRNFVRFSLPYADINIAFSKRQLTDERLIPTTEEMIKQLLHYAGTKNIKSSLAKEWQRLIAGLDKLVPVYDEWEIKLARLFVQSAHPIVTHLILLEQIEVFISFGFEIGDVMDIQTWKTSGKNSGMQSTGGLANAIYVSCGGNPFTSDKEYATYATDGFASMARMLTIAGQETGHYADIIRDQRGRHTSRHSADIYGTKAKPHVKTGRINDINTGQAIHQQLCRIGLNRLASLDRYHHHLKKFNVKHRTRLGLLVLARFIVRQIFCLRAKLNGYHFIFKLKKEKYLGQQLVICFEDMQFNLSPKADVYQRDDSDAEEAIACIEALARVPQQVNKWGHDVTKLYMQDLYHIYYEEVIPSCIASYEQLSGQNFLPKQTFRSKPLWLRVKHLFKKPLKPSVTPLIME